MVEQMHEVLCVPITPEKKKIEKKWGRQGMASVETVPVTWFRWL